MSVTFAWFFCFTLFLMDSIQQRYEKFMSILLLVAGQICWMLPPTLIQRRNTFIISDSQEIQTEEQSKKWNQKLDHEIKMFPKKKRKNKQMICST